MLTSAIGCLGLYDQCLVARIASRCCQYCLPSSHDKGSAARRWHDRGVMLELSWFACCEESVYVYLCWRCRCTSLLLSPNSTIANLKLLCTSLSQIQSPEYLKLSSRQTSSKHVPSPAHRLKQQLGLLQKHKLGLFRGLRSDDLEQLQPEAQKQPQRKQLRHAITATVALQRRIGATYPTKQRRQRARPLQGPS